MLPFSVGWNLRYFICKLSRAWRNVCTFLWQVSWKLSVFSKQMVEVGTTLGAFRIRAERASLNLLFSLLFTSLYRPLTSQNIIQFMLHKIQVITDWTNHLFAQFSYDDSQECKSFHRGHNETSVINKQQILPLKCDYVGLCREGRMLSDSKIKVREFEKRKERGGHPVSFQG